jgi:hypothetical protein
VCSVWQTLITNFSYLVGNPNSNLYSHLHMYLCFVSRHSFVYFYFCFSYLRHPVNKMGNLRYRVIYEYEFHRGTSAAGTARRVNDVCSGCVAKKITVRFWYERFCSGNFALQNKPHGRPETQFSNEELKAIVETDPSQITSELAAGCGVCNKTVLIHLKQIGKIKKLERYLTN